MPPTVATRLDDDVAIVTIDNPPVNAIGPDVVAGLHREITAADAHASVRAVVVVGAGRTFVAGADIKVLERLAWGDLSGAPDMHETFAAIEACSKPVVMAVHGTALGGGLELAMAGHYRVASADASLGQPEVNLGLIPGAEGTQRLPRLVGVPKALEMCVSGSPISARDALTAGLVDWVVDGDLLGGALALAREKATIPGPLQRTRDRRDRLPSAAEIPSLVEAARVRAAASRPHLEAPRAVIDAVAAAATLPFDEGCQLERRLFMACARSEQAKALIYAFFAERAVSKVPGISTERPPAVGRVGVVGVGTMGRGIAMACANAGLDVVLTDVTREALDDGLAAIARAYESAASQGHLTTADARARQARISGHVRIDALRTADLIVEAVIEDLDVKRAVFAELDREARPESVLATNTSTLDIDRIASATTRPERVLGMHCVRPAHATRLIEIVRAHRTSPGAVASALALAKRLGKVGVVVGNALGFVGNRLMRPYMDEAQFLVEEGASPRQVDAALTDFGMAMGIFAATVDEVDRFIEARPHAVGVARRPIPDEEIVERLVLTLVNEGARALDAGVARRAIDIDVIYVTGYGFPAFRGGPMFYADRLGLPHVLSRISALHEAHGARWQAAPLLTRLAGEGRTFRQFDADAAE